MNSDICFFQETEINDFENLDIYQIPGFNLHLSNNTPKSRLCAYVKSNIKVKVDTTTDLEVIKPKKYKFTAYTGHSKSNRATPTPIISKN